jgi:hypothetical protein
MGFVQHIKTIILLKNGGQLIRRKKMKKKSRICKKILLCGLVRRSLGYKTVSVSVIKSFHNILKKYFFVENGGQRNQENEKKNIVFTKNFPALWTRASESRHLVQIIGSVSVIWGLFNISK